VTGGGIAGLKALHRGHFLCGVVPVLTIYLKDPPTGDLASSALTVYRELCPSAKQEFVSGTQAPAFAKATSNAGRAILDSHLERMNLRKDEGVTVWDGESEESWSFSIQGVPPDANGARASFCHVLFPNDVEPSLILQVTTSLGEALPFLSGHAGLTSVFSATYKHEAFDQIYAWAKRYPGLEVEDLNVTLPYVTQGIKGANWLTLVGGGLWSGILEATTSRPNFSSGIVQRQTAHGVVLRAGEVPVLGDRNHADWVELYVEVERALVSSKIKRHGEFAGRFERESATLGWLNRLVVPRSW
jgi:hypothetical protein